MLSVVLVVFSQGVYAETKMQVEDIAIMKERPATIIVGAKAAKYCCTTPDGWDCYGYSCSKCRKSCKGKAGKLLETIKEKE
jgi:hypothetical protein